MRILVLGSRGQLGQAIAKQEYMYSDASLTFSYESFDITDFSLTKLKLKSERPNVIINAAAFTQVDLAEDLQVEANKVNFEAVDHLANLCLDLKCGLIHISTDYVFDGSLIRPYVETDSTNPKSSYGVSKLRGEEAIQKSGCCYVIIRSSWIFSEF